MSLLYVKLRDLVFYFVLPMFFLKKGWTLQQNFIKIIAILPFQ
jgi:hypothetical protein